MIDFILGLLRRRDLEKVERVRGRASEDDYVKIESGHLRLYTEYSGIKSFRVSHTTTI